MSIPVFRYSATFLASIACVSAAFAEPPQRFVGEWRSDKSGHGGPMRAKLTPTTSGYDALVAGRFAIVIPFVYRTHFAIAGCTPEGPRLVAEKKLPLFGGSFKTGGVLTADGFVADYSALKDTGKFTLKRRR